MARDIVQPDLFRLSEAWLDEASHEAHVKSPHLKRNLEEVGHMVLPAVTLNRIM